MKKIILYLVLSQFVSLSHAGLMAFEANYQLTKNQKLLGETYFQLLQKDDNWSYLSKTQAQKGLAGALGGQIDESSQFKYDHDKIYPLFTQYQQKVLFSKRLSTAQFDWKKLKVSGSHKKENWQEDLYQNTLDRLTINLQLMKDVAKADHPLDYRVQDKHHIRNWKFLRLGTDYIETPAGSFQAVHLKRDDDNPKRETHLWLAPKLNYFPVRFKHREKKNWFQSDLTTLQGPLAQSLEDVLLESHFTPAESNKQH